MPEITIREATPQNLVAIRAIEQASHLSPWSEKQLLDSIHGEHNCRLLLIDNKLCAYLILSAVVDEMEILNIAVSPDNQRKGLASYLMRDLIQLARQQAIARVFLEVRQSNQAAIQLYQKHGFQRVGLRKNYYAGSQGREDGLLMRLELDGCAKFDSAGKLNRIQA